MRILIDLDNVLADFEGGFITKWNEMYPAQDCPIEKNREHFEIGKDLEKETKVQIWHVINSAGFFASLRPLPGAIEAVHYIVGSEEHEAAVVTSPGSYEHAPSDKYRWVYEHLGKDMLRHLVVTRSKYLASGDVLIDDKPQIRHSEHANWEHIIFERSYNKDIKDKRNLNWDNYKDILGI